MLINTPHWRRCFQPAVSLLPTTIFVRRFKQNLNILETPVLPLGSGHEENAREGIAALLTVFLPAIEKAGDDSEELLEDARVTKISPATTRTWKASCHIDFELLGEHLVLLGNQGVGKKQDHRRAVPGLREYIQLHRDSTVQQLMFQTTLEHGVVRCTDSPLLRVVAHRCELVVDKAGKAPEHVFAIFRSLAGQGELILLANRPGYLLWNHFMQVLGISAART
ncbi:hypothetical protein EDB86DRAFT_1662577 [Lactarius hatsudake]|nr:hypothetical protein EDB86DRAFT_1662577 [Lactarius hatsudake]